MVERKMVTGQGYGLGIGGCKSCVTEEAGHSLVTLFFPVWSVKDRSLHMTLGRS